MFGGIFIFLCGLPYSATALPALSTVHFDRRKIERISAEAILADLDGRPLDDRILDIGFHIIERECA
ncbi:hypothetical protein [Rhodoblastus acidophilus]|uniref:hypothetical protein n=1 Tax=Rhodoblastus acidophilus TaxID=1074 RepID=UPI000B506810|nr:hypothetical protein [Rhodoblastus acidophilus]PPQ36060.1 hypothetical protein CKO16_18935 [Rhodoblastus acidophilus]RAI18793.1 hypothetical protein CH337_13610 [Rhodoblastus acidophilus]